jgi:hypothetical protein
MSNPHQIQRVEDKRSKHWFGVKNIEFNEFTSSLILIRLDRSSIFSVTHILTTNSNHFEAKVKKIKLHVINENLIRCLKWDD